MSDALLEAVRGLCLADPGLGPKPLLAKLREQHPDLGAGAREVREALLALKAESEAAKANAAVPPAAIAPPAAVERGAPLPVALSLTCRIGCSITKGTHDTRRTRHANPCTLWCGVES